MAPPVKNKEKLRRNVDKLVGIQKKKQSSRRLFNYSEDSLIKALEEIKSNRMGIREACRIYGVPKTTVHDRLSGKVAENKKPKVGPDPVLGREGEEKIKNWILDMARCGFPINKKDLFESVTKIVRDTGIKNPFKDGIPGGTWYQSFMKRHPEISIREAEGINNARAAVTEHRIRQWFKELRDHMTSIDAMDIFDDPDRIFNGDETGFSLCPKSGKVLGPKGYKNLYQIKKGNEKENVTVLVVFTATGKVYPPLVVFTYIRPPKALVDSMPPSWILGRSESGWMKSDVFYEYICNSFHSWLINNNIKRPIILFIDGHKSHMSLSLSQFCEDNGIILYALPANTTHILQPADVGVFKPLKTEWKNTVRVWQKREKNINCSVTKINFCEILKETFTAINLDEAIKNGFRKCGLYPLCEDAVDYSKCVKDTRHKISSNSSGKKTISAKDYDTATKVISLIKNDIDKYIDTNIILAEIEKAKAKLLDNRRSKSKTPRNSSNISTSIITDNLIDNLSFIEPQFAVQDTVPDIYNASCSYENINFAVDGSFVSLNDVSLMPLNEIEIVLSQNQCNKAVDIRAPDESTCASTSNILKQTVPENRVTNKNNTLELYDIFEKHLKYPEPPAPKDKIRKASLPSAISANSWRELYNKKNEDKENQIKEKLRKRELKAEEKERKSKEKNIKPKTKKEQKKNKKTLLKCSQCSEDLISDAEDDLEKNLGCDACIRWFHLKCTNLSDKSYLEAAKFQFTCKYCTKYLCHPNH